MKAVSLNIRWLILCCSVILCLAATCKQEAGKESACNTTGEVQDFTGLDGCKLLIVTDNGTKLLPAGILSSDVTLVAGQKIRFSYRPVEMVSICMAEDLIVEITCLEVIGD